MRELNIRNTAVALFIALAASYILCILGDVLFGWTMYRSWMPLLPGFTWPLTVQGFLLGALWLVAYSVYVPIVFVMPYNYFVSRSAPRGHVA